MSLDYEIQVYNYLSETGIDSEVVTSWWSREWR